MAHLRRLGGFNRLRIPRVHKPVGFRQSSYKVRLLRLRLINFLSSFSIIAGIAFLILTFFLFLWYSKDLPSPSKVQRKEGFSTVVLDKNEKPLYDIFTDKNRIPVAFSDIPDHLKKATIAIEDKDFYKHQGFDTRGIIRAIFHILTLRGIEGGSTLTQQLVKNVLLSQDRTLPRKIKEFILAVQIERKYKKDEILQMYLNESPYGGTMWGIEAAAKGYFGKHAKDLTLAESVILAGFPQRPSYYSPFGQNPKAYIDRAEQVLRRMREDGHIVQVLELETKRELASVKFTSPSSAFIAPHFVMYVKKQLTEMFGEDLVEGTGLRVTTTLDSELQEKVETIVVEELDKLKGLNVTNGASIVINPQTGEILAYVGSKEYDSEDTEFQGKFDVVSQGLRQPGSALKPITYAAAFAKGYNASSFLMDVETHFPGGKDKPDYVPKNYDGKHRGPIQLRFALGNSINIPAVKLTALVGVKEILKTAYEMGITTLEPTDSNVERLGLSLTLGGGEVRLIDLTSAFGIITSGGERFDPYAIVKVTDSGGKTLYEHKKISGKRVLSQEVAFLVADILSDNNARKEVFGSNSYLNIGGKAVAVKTGTTDDKRDNWTVGGITQAVAGVWVGNNDNSPMSPKLASGATGAAPIWNRIIKEILKKTSDEPFDQSDNIVEVEIDSLGEGLAKEDRPMRKEYFIKGTEPTALSSIYKKIKLSKSDNNKLANPVEIATGSYDEKEFIVFVESDPTARSGENKWQEAIDKWLESQSDSIYHPPKDTSSANENTVAVRIKKPSDKTQIDSNDVEVEAQAQALRDIKKMELYVDDSLKTSVNNNSFHENIILETGVHKIKVKAFDEAGNSGDSEVTIGVKVSPDSPSPTAIPVSTITPSPTP